MTTPIVIIATVDADQSVEPCAPNRWIAKVSNPEPLAGLFALGDSFQEARESLARTAWEAATMLDPKLAQTHDGVRVLAATRKTFPVATLTTQQD